MRNEIKHRTVDFVNCRYTEHATQYSQQHDAAFCFECNIWLEGKCDDYLCYFCVGRPEKPLNGT